MYCTHCGTLNQDAIPACTSCGQTLPHFPGEVPSYLWQSIVVTVCCCMPFGIPAIVFAAQVNSKLLGGDVTGAMDSSRKAKTFCWIAFSIGLAFQLAYAVLLVIGIIADM